MVRIDVIYSKFLSSFCWTLAPYSSIPPYLYSVHSSTECLWRHLSLLLLTRTFLLSLNCTISSAQVEKAKRRRTYRGSLTISPIHSRSYINRDHNHHVYPS